MQRLIALLLALFLASFVPPHARAQCVQQDLDPAVGEAVLLARNGDLLGVVSNQGGAFELYRWSGTGWALEATAPLPLSLEGSSSSLTGGAIAVSEDTLLIHVTSFFDSYLYISERVVGQFQPFQSCFLSSNSWPSGNEYRSAIRFSADGDRFVLSWARFHYSEGVLQEWVRGPSGWSPLRYWHGGFGLNPQHHSLGAALAHSKGRVLAGAPETSPSGRAYFIDGFFQGATFPAPYFESGIGTVTGYGAFVGLSGDHMAIAAESGPGLPVELFHDLGGASAAWSSMGALPVPPTHGGGAVTGLDLADNRLVVAVASESSVYEYELDAGTATLVATRRGSANSLGNFVVRTPYGTIADADGETPFWPEDVHVRAHCHCASAPCGNASNLGGCLNSAGTAAELRGCGTTSASADDLVLRIDGLPSSTWGTVFMGRLGLPVALHNGLYCLGAPAYRFGPQAASGTSLEATDLVAFTRSHNPPAAQIEAGQTWSFQAWYRDVGGPCGGASNLTNALTVTFVP